MEEGHASGDYFGEGRDIKKDIIELFMNVGKDYLNNGLLKEAEIKRGSDIHAFYRLSRNPSQVIHVQGYPGLSNDNEARVWARLMDYDTMVWLRDKRKASPGNEHQATIRFFPNFEMGIMIPYKTEDLKEKLEEMVRELW
jgi:hypothetical protein